MKNKQLWLLTGLFLLTLAWGAGQTRAADAVVGDGSPASCTEAAFDNALAAVQADLGGVITFNCGDAVHMIDIYSTAVIYTQVEINGGDKIHLFAQGSAPLFVKSRFFEVSPGGWLTLRNITLEGARGPAGDGWGSQGGSIVVWGSEDPQERTGLELFSTTILNSASTAWGGAIANEGANVTIENSYIGNSSAKWGGAYHGANGYDTIVNSTITASTAVLGGGGVRFWNSLNSEISGSVINTNSAGGAGGGVENAGGVVTISGSYIEDNTAVQWGGGLKNSNNAGRAATLHVENSRISGNWTDANGGGVDSNGLLVVSDTAVSDNIAGNLGGGILSWGGQLRVIRASVMGNLADSGGGLYVYGGGVVIDSATIANNEASVDGGGLFLTEIAGANANNWVTITATGITGNQANLAGGGIVANRAYATLRDTDISGNSSTFGAVHLWQTASGGSYVVVTQSSVHSNTGGGFFNGEQGTLLVGNSTISQNDGWGVWAGQGSIYTQLKFSTVRGNASGQIQRTGGPLALEAAAIDAGGAPVANCVTAVGLTAVASTQSWSSDASCGQPVFVSSNFNLGPLEFNDGTTLNHMPQAGSVLIDAASCADTPLDQRGAIRPYGAACDVGAVEYGANVALKVYLPLVIRP